MRRPRRLLLVRRVGDRAVGVASSRVRRSLVGCRSVRRLLQRACVDVGVRPRLGHRGLCRHRRAGDVVRHVGVSGARRRCSTSSVSTSTRPSPRARLRSLVPRAWPKRGSPLRLATRCRGRQRSPRGRRGRTPSGPLVVPATIVAGRARGSNRRLLPRRRCGSRGREIFARDRVVLGVGLGPGIFVTEEIGPAVARGAGAADLT